MTDKSVTQLLGVLPRCAVRTLRVDGTRVSAMNQTELESTLHMLTLRPDLASVRSNKRQNSAARTLLWSQNGARHITDADVGSLVQALQTNNTLTTVDLTNNTGVTDASIDAIGELIGPRGKVTVSNCFGLCSKSTISAVHTVTLQGTAVSVGKQRWLAAQVTLRQLSSKRYRSSTIDWVSTASSDLGNSTADSKMFVTDLEVEALTKSLRSNSSITSIDISGNWSVTDRSVQPLMAVLPRCAVRTLRVSGTGVTTATAHKINDRMLEMMPWSPCWARCCWPCGGSESKLRSCLRNTQTAAGNACTSACWCKYAKPIRYLLAKPFLVLALPLLPFVGLYFAQQYLARKWRGRPVAPELTRVAGNSTAMRQLHWGGNTKTNADVGSLVQALQTNNTLTTIN